MSALGKYELLELLGSGATAEVYRARDTVLQREVAVKILRPALVTDATAFARFVQEAQSAASLFHPHIATVLDTGEDGGRFFIVLRYFPGQSLDQLLRRQGPLAWERVLTLAHQIGGALEYAHQAGLLHRDVKPSNIICTPESNYALSDFGLARALQTSGLTSHTGVALGTPAYIAPEIWMGQLATPATDQYAFGCVLVEAMTGQILFQGETPALMYGHAIRGAVLPPTWPEGVPHGVTVVLAKAVAKDPTERFASMGALVTALTDAAQESQHKLRLEEEARRREQADAERKRQQELLEQITAREKALQIEENRLAGERLALQQKQAEAPKAAPAATPGKAEDLLSRMAQTLQQKQAEAPEAAPAATPGKAEDLLSTMVQTRRQAFEQNRVTAAETDPMDSDNPARIAWVDIPAGEFLFGEGKQKISIPQPYQISKYPVTNRQYKDFIDAKFPYQVPVHWDEWRSYPPEKADHPVVNVSWEDANAFCAWAGCQLPTEQEWEKAARGTDGRTYSWGEQETQPNMANFDKNIGDTTPVGSYPAGASPYGVLDMTGNVWEWTASKHEYRGYTFRGSS